MRISCGLASEDDLRRFLAGDYLEKGKLELDRVALSESAFNLDLKLDHMRRVRNSSFKLYSVLGRTLCNEGFAHLLKNAGLA